mmetsp:Transcript_8136/g.10339  ORF Transcript_8136/g.10339 Transcript_8136/m.10339 type:complete len:81 (+) Transcript_8136:461-703(+)
MDSSISGNELALSKRVQFDQKPLIHEIAGDCSPPLVLDTTDTGCDKFGSVKEKNSSPSVIEKVLKKRYSRLAKKVHAVGR